MFARRLAQLGLFIVLAPAFALTAHASNTLMRYPTLHGNSVVFEAHGNLWEVNRAGGTAWRLTSDPGFDIMPRFSPDGKWIAFTGQYRGNTDVYVIPAAGGKAKRLTFHSDVVKDAPLRWGPDNMVVTWTPDSKNIVFLSRRNTFNSWFGRLFTVPIDGGLPTQLPLPKGGMLTYSPDGHSIAYNRIFRNFRTWKRYKGGLAQDVWLYDFATKKSSRITDYPGADMDPMWYGHLIYFISDRGTATRKNLWVYDINTKQFRQVTHFTDYDISWPSLGDTGIVFQDGADLYVLDLPSEQLHKLEVTVPDDGTRTGPRRVDASKYLELDDTAGDTNIALSPNGKRALLQARGDIWSLPREHGPSRDLTDTSNAEEEYPSWSPDGKWIAYATDVNGEDQLAVRSAGDTGAEQVLTHFKTGYFYGPTWSPGSDKLAFSDNEHRLWILDVKSRKLTQVAQDKNNEMHDYSWSPDGRWLAYSTGNVHGIHQIWLYNLASGKATRVSSPMDNDQGPVFDPDGKYLYFVSARHENPTFSETEFNIATLQMYGVYVTTLSKGEASPFAPRNDEGTLSQSDKKNKPVKWKPGNSKPVNIDLDGLMARAVPLPIPAANISGLAATPGHVFYSTAPNQTIGGPLPGMKPELHVYDLAKRDDKTLVTDLSGWILSADGSTVLYTKKGDKLYTRDTNPDDKAKPKPLDTSHMWVEVDPVAEWNEMYHMAWRLYRDFFWNRKMNGVDWDAVGAKYAKLLPLAGSREDLNYLIGQILGELSNSHTYVGGGDVDYHVHEAPTGLLGVDFGLDAASGRYYFKKIYPGDNTRDDFRSPLTEPGVNVQQGDFLLAVDGRRLKAPTNPYSLFVGTADRDVWLTVADNATGKNTRRVLVKTIPNELKIRLRAWIDHNRDEVSKLSDGKIGYIYLSDMGALGMHQFIRQFYPQLTRQGLIIDDRYNGGGFIDPIVLERLRRILIGMNSNRQRIAAPIPSQLSYSYKAALINHYSASDGDIFPYFFRKYGLGPLIGTRTWGGVRGIRGEWPLLDGGYITVSEGTMYGLDSQWVIENHGVEPDTEVDDLPEDVMRGYDAQLHTAVDGLMKKIKAHPLVLPPPPPLVPAYPPPRGQTH
ncbi:MAG: S41 family peptidase [Rhodanobacteraceae bacterium]